MKNKKSSLKRKLVTGILAVASLFPSASLKAKETISENFRDRPARVLEMDFAHPFATSESRAKTTYSANQIVDYLINKKEDDALSVRVAKTIGDLYGKYFTAYIFHEAGHEGEDLKFKGGFRKTLTPRIASTKESFNTPEQRAEYFSDGINQNTLNATTIWSNGVRHKNFDNSGFLFNSLYGAFYSTNKDTRSDGNTIDDLEGYCEALGEIGIRETPKNLKRKSLLASTLTLQNYASVFNLINYTRTGQVNNGPLTFEIKGLEMTPPVFSHYLTDRGSYFQGDMFVNLNGKNPAQISAGFQDDKFRVGSKIYDLEATERLSFSPYVFADTFGGHSIGSDVKYKLTDKLKLIARIEQNQKDILESRVKDKGNGVNFSAGFEVRF